MYGLVAESLNVEASFPARPTPAMLCITFSGIQLNLPFPFNTIHAQSPLCRMNHATIVFACLIGATNQLIYRTANVIDLRSMTET